MASLIVVSSCVKTIQEALSSLSPPPLSISSSVSERSVTVVHSDDLKTEMIKEALEDAGFDLISALPSDNFNVEVPPARKSSESARKKDKHAEHCTLCRQDSMSAELGARSNDDHGYDGPLRITMSVGGMTCAACVATITEMVSPLEDVTDVSVDLIGKSSTVTVARRDLIQTVIDTIEDCGFECVVMVTKPLENTSQKVAGGVRTVSLRIGGMFSRYAVAKRECRSCHRADSYA